MLNSFKYEFLDELEYDYNGDKKIAEFLEIKAPSNKLKLFLCTLQCAYSCATDKIEEKFTTSMSKMSREELQMAIEVSQEANKKQAKDKSNKKTEIDEKESIITAITNSIFSACKDSQVNSVFDALDQILRKSALIDGHTEFGSAIFPELSFNDTKRLLGEYIYNFFISSPQV